LRQRACCQNDQTRTNSELEGVAHDVTPVRSSAALARDAPR